MGQVGTTAQAAEHGQRAPWRVRKLSKHLDLALAAAQVAVDVIMLNLATLFAYLIRQNFELFEPFSPASPVSYIVMNVAMSVILPMAFASQKLYSVKGLRSRVDEFFRVIAGVSLTVLVALAISSLILGEDFSYSRQLLVTEWVLAILFLTAGRGTVSLLGNRLRARGVGQRRLLIVGEHDPASLIVDRVRSHPELGYELVGLLTRSGTEEDVLGSFDDLESVVREKTVDEVIFALNGTSHQTVLELIGQCEDLNVSLKVFPDVFQLLTEGEANVSDLQGVPLLEVRDVSLRGWNRALKRAFDVVFSAAVLVLFSPLMLLIALLIKLTSPGPVFYIQERVGIDGRPFLIYKFRTMYVGAEEDTGPVWAKPNDPRRTPLGRILRRFSLDELPQFINVLLGEMSVVGPRPERPYFVEQFRQQIPKYMRRHREKAGITGWAQVNGLRGDTSIEERTKYDLYYVEHWSLIFDLKIILKTIVRIFRDKNAY
jgi:exopolysaccharide biosynthesis polyprenyl glycosylphosphotransferase